METAAFNDRYKEVFEKKFGSERILLEELSQYKVFGEKLELYLNNLVRCFNFSALPVSTYCFKRMKSTTSKFFVLYNNISGIEMYLYVHVHSDYIEISVKKMIIAFLFEKNLSYYSEPKLLINNIVENYIQINNDDLDIDVSLLQINKSNDDIEYFGFRNNLLIVQNKKIEQLKGKRTLTNGFQLDHLNTKISTDICNKNIYLFNSIWQKDHLGNNSEKLNFKSIVECLVNNSNVSNEMDQRIENELNLLFSDAINSLDILILRIGL